MALIKTPIYKLSNNSDVYEPREDSFLFLDALEDEIEFMKDLQPKFIAEIGSGSGIIITSVANIFHDDSFCFATDINNNACKATCSTAKLNNELIECVNMNFLDNFKPNLFDIILFNPPYVVTESSEISMNKLSWAWAGGENGREIIDKFLNKMPDLLSSKGVFYLVTIKENNVTDIGNMMLKLGFNMTIVKERKIPGEHLLVLKFARF